MLRNMRININQVNAVFIRHFIGCPYYETLVISSGVVPIHFFIKSSKGVYVLDCVC